MTILAYILGFAFLLFCLFAPAGIIVFGSAGLSQWRRDLRKQNKGTDKEFDFK